jgi:hypothetical protein
MLQNDSQKFEASTCWKILLVVDLLQLIQLGECIALHSQSNESERKNTKFSLQVMGFIFLVYIIMTLLKKFNKDRIDCTTQIAFYFIFLV